MPKKNKVEQMEKGDFSGNTKKKNPKDTKPRVVQTRYWVFTYNNYENDDVKILEQRFKEMECKYIFGKEVGEQGTPHLQGFVVCPKKIRWSEFKLTNKIHWEKMKKTVEQNIMYCSKDNNYYTNFEKKYFKKKKPLKILQESQFYMWQKEVVKIVDNDPDDRSIWWFWETKGNVGKTTFCKYLCHEYGAVIIEGKKNDILHCAAEAETDIYIFDFERSMEEYISYSAMEKIKNGMFMSGKYESKMILRNSPHVICFANFKPDISKLSADRWKIHKLKNDEYYDKKDFGPDDPEESDSDESELGQDKLKKLFTSQ